MKKNAHQAIKKLLKGGDTITGLEALEFFQCFRLAPVIFRLRNEGLNIVNVGNPGSFAKYKLMRKGANK